MRRHLVALGAAVALVALVLAGCGDDDDGVEPDPDTPDVVDPTPDDPDPDDPSDPDAPDPGDTEEGLEPVGTPGTDEQASPDFPFGGGDQVFLTDVRVATQEGFDRVVLEFDGGDVPAYRVAFVDPPIREDASGNEIAVAGEAFLELRTTPASGVDLRGAEILETYTGPDRIDLGGTVVTEVVRTGDFEANMAWVVGLRAATPFAVAWFEDPLRLVVDVVPAD